MLKFTVKSPELSQIEKVVQGGIKQLLEQKISGLVCPEHAKGAEIFTTEQGYAFNVCCDAFEKTVNEAIRATPPLDGK